MPVLRVLARQRISQTQLCCPQLWASTTTTTTTTTTSTTTCYPPPPPPPPPLSALTLHMQGQKINSNPRPRLSVFLGKSFHNFFCHIIIHPYMQWPNKTWLYCSISSQSSHCSCMNISSNSSLSSSINSCSVRTSLDF